MDTKDSGRLRTPEIRLGHVARKGALLGVAVTAAVALCSVVILPLMAVVLGTGGALDLLPLALALGFVVLVFGSVPGMIGGALNALVIAAVRRRRPVPVAGWLAVGISSGILWGLATAIAALELLNPFVPAFTSPVKANFGGVGLYFLGPALTFAAIAGACHSWLLVRRFRW